MTNEQVRDFLHTPQGQARLARIAAVARAAAQAAQQHGEADAVEVEGREISAVPGGMCCKFARQCHELAAGLPDHGWPFASPSAADTEKLLREANRQVGGAIPGAVGFWDDGTVGHIVVCLGNGLVAENTSSWRGDPSRPGTKVTSLQEVRRFHGGDYGRWYFAGQI